MSRGFNYIIPLLPFYRRRSGNDAASRRMTGAARGVVIMVWCVLAFGTVMGAAAPGYAWNRAASDKLSRLIGHQDSVAVMDAQNQLVYSKNIDQPRIPASTLKLLTGLAAFDIFGPNYRFRTDFYTDDAHSLKVQGFGDPLLISEVLSEIAGRLTGRLTMPTIDLILDDSYFQEPLVIPGVTDSLNPYDAPNGALCANFNTVYYQRKNGVYISAEPQTPLLPVVMDRIRQSGVDHGRIVLSHRKQELLMYAGQLLAYFLAEKGQPVQGTIRAGRVNAEADRLVLRHRSPFTMTQVIERMLEFSNNYVANQVLIAAGARTYGPPGTLDKGVRVLNDYLENHLDANGAVLVEGSGISRKNRLSARTLLQILDRFAPYRHLLQQEGPVRFKTGTLHGIRTRAGYIEGGENQVYRFVILLNSNRYSADRIVSIIQRGLEDQ